MAFYHNHTRVEAIVTLRIVSVQGQKSSLGIGIPSSMKALVIPVGVHDIRVGPDEILDPEEGLTVEFIGARCV